MTGWRTGVRRAATAVGAAVLAFAFVLDWAVTTGIVPTEWVRPAWSGSVVVAGFTTVAVCAIALVVNHRWLLGRSSTGPAETPESAASVPRSGSDTDEVLGGVFSATHRTEAARRRTRSRLREAAVRTVARRRSIPRERAEHLVATGDWTHDDAAAAFLGDVFEPRRVRLRRRVSTRLAFRYQARRTARAVVAADGRAES